MNNQIKIFKSDKWSLDSARDKQDYELLDTGEGEKLERFGRYTFVRPSESAIWKKTLPGQDWANADGKYWSSKAGAKKGWVINKKVEDKWTMSYSGIKFISAPTPFRHFGFFPEQATHWDFIEEKIKKASGEGRKIKFLNLFGYTGVASLFALRAGAEVTHLDASKQILDWAKENQKLNAGAGLDKMPFRVISDDVMKFLVREEKRGNKYDAVIMDPPKHGRGPKGEVWKIEEDLPKLLAQLKKVLSNDPLFVILTSYTTDYSSLAPGYALEDTMKNFGGNLEVGELCIPESSNKRLISMANTAVWSRT